ncbi:MAG TPA: D-glycero-beta-D-manno-heptose 1,7-bisphosphate 7-phosphatase [Caldithrix sp.]|nr:D-glycero-beta-D-manno-heptose 1,7-bisphosphate 7-phosphatase [Caldithrix sp.]
MKKAVFLDRDGTINEEMGYINHASRFIIFDFVPEAIKILNECGFLVLIVTNQSGVARGYFSEELLISLHNNLIAKVEKNQAKIEKIYYCPHHPNEGIKKYKLDCNCRKPKPGMIEMARDEYNIDLGDSYIIGDRYKDVQFGQNMGLHTIMVLTGYGLGEYSYQNKDWPTQPEYICNNLLDAANLIKSIQSKY